MKSKTTEVNNVDTYIATFPEPTQKLLQQLRAAIKKTAPEAEEVISYKMPAYKFQGMLVYFAGYKNHIGFYPMPSATGTFKKELAVYKSAKASIQFPLDKPLPLQLIKKMVAFRMMENQEKMDIKKK